MRLLTAAPRPLNVNSSPMEQTAIESLAAKLKSEGQITLELKVAPKNGKNEINGLKDGILKIKIKAAPENNKANLELVKFLGKTFDVAKSNIQILKGHTSHFKTVLITSGK